QLRKKRIVVLGTSWVDRVGNSVDTSELITCPDSYDLLAESFEPLGQSKPEPTRIDEDDAKLAVAVQSGGVYMNRLFPNGCVKPIGDLCLLLQLGFVLLTACSRRSRIDPVPLPLEWIGRQLHAMSALMTVKALPVNVNAGQPEPA